MSDVPAGGTMSARAVARMYAALLGEVDGVQLVSPERLREISAVAFEGIDQVFGNPARYALGYAVGRPVPDAPNTSTVIGWSGAGGSHADADTATGITFALTKNRFTGGQFDTVAHVAGIVTTAAAGS